MQNSIRSIGTLIVSLFVAFSLGVAWEHTRLAFQDLRSTEAKVKGLRDHAWRSVWAVIKASALVILVCWAVIHWVQRDRQDAGPTPLIPTRSADPVHPYVPKTFGDD